MHIKDKNLKAKENYTKPVWRGMYIRVHSISYASIVAILSLFLYCCKSGKSVYV